VIHLSRRSICVFWILLLVAALCSGCGTIRQEKTTMTDAPEMSTSPASVNQLPLEEYAPLEPTSEKNVDGETGTNSAAVDQDSLEVQPGVTLPSTKSASSTPASPPTQKSASLITKSENAVTETERFELLNTLKYQIDTLVELLDSMDLLQESELDLDSFEE
jgi:hypothetical protein